MSQDDSFGSRLAKLRQGDEAAIREFVAMYEPHIRRSLRQRLKRAGLQAIADSADVCQSVFGSFLIRIAAGEYEVESEENLQKLLLSIARKNFAALTRHEFADRRDRSRVRSLLSDHDVPGSAHDEPGQNAETLDLLDYVKNRLSEDEKSLFIDRQKGRTWDEIAAKHDESPVILRKRLSRALRRVTVELGLEDEDE